MDIVHALEQFMIRHIAMTFWLILVIVLASAMGSFMPKPKDGGPIWYALLFALCQGLAFNIGRVWHIMWPWAQKRFGLGTNGNGNSSNPPAPTPAPPDGGH